MKKAMNNKGAAMIAVLCLMAIFLTLCLSMLLTSSVLIHQSQQRFSEEQCKVSAVTFSKELEYDLCNDSTSSIYAFMQRNIDINNWSRWPYFNPDELNHGDQSPGVYRTFTSDTTGDTTAGALSVLLYWEYTMGGSLSDIYLHVDVTAQKGGERYTVKAVYNVQEDEHNQWVWTRDMDTPAG